MPTIPSFCFSYYLSYSVFLSVFTSVFLSAFISFPLSLSFSFIPSINFLAYPLSSLSCSYLSLLHLSFFLVSYLFIIILTSSFNFYSIFTRSLFRLLNSLFIFISMTKSDKYRNNSFSDCRTNSCQPLPSPLVLILDGNSEHDALA